MFQISIASDWRAKVRATATTIRENFPQAKVLVFVTNLAIGAEWTTSARTEVQHGLFSEPRARIGSLIERRRWAAEAAPSSSHQK